MNIQTTESVSNRSAYPAWLLAELRSDQAGETGAVAIYQGILAASADPALHAFANEHLQTERRHLQLIDAELPRTERSVFLPIWRLAGFLTGVLPALFGANAVYATIDAVETFVDKHYSQQLHRLQQEDIFPELQALIERCRSEELMHRDQAREACQRRGLLLRGWCWLVGAGSSAAVRLAWFL